jgi:hypothetical protein
LRGRIQFLKKHNVGEDYRIKIDKELRGVDKRFLDKFFVDINTHFIHIVHKSKEILIE